MATGRVFDKIADADATHEIEEIIADGGYYGMQTFDQNLLTLYEKGTVSRRDAMATATHPHDLRLQIDQLEMRRAEALQLQDPASSVA